MVHPDGSSYCSCDWFYTGEFCQTERMVPPGDSNTNTTTTAATGTGAGAGTPTSASANDSLRSLEERTCVPGFVCLHGRCAEGASLACRCDPGWVGALCQTPCTLDCGPLGLCRATGVGQELKMHCSCRGGYSGPRCRTGPTSEWLMDGWMD